MSEKLNEPTFEELLAAIKERCDAGDVQRARRYFAKNPGNGMDDCMRWGEGLCVTCAEMATSPALGNELDIFCEYSLADVPRLLELVKAAIEMIPEDCYHRENMGYLTRILAGEGESE